MEMTDQELQPLRQVAVSLMNDVATIERVTSVDDGSLGTVDTWAAIAENVPCRVAERELAGDYETTQAGRLTSVGEHAIRFPYGTDIRETDRIKVLSLSLPRAFEVSRVIEHSYATTTTVICVEAR